MHAAVGGGMYTDINDGADAYDGVIKFELGGIIGGSWAWSIGADYVPITGSSDQIMAYGNMSLLP